MSIIKELVGQADVCIRGVDGRLIKIKVREGKKPYTKRLTVAELNDNYDEKKPIVETYESNVKLLESFVYWVCHVWEK